MNVSKTNCMLICTPQKRLRLVSDVLDLYIDEICFTNVTHQNVLGVTIDNSLKFDIHVENICKKLSKLSYLLSQIKYYLTYDAKLNFYYSYILPCFDYCITAWGYSSKGNLDKLYKFQKRIGRQILNDFDCSSDLLFKRLGWLTIYERLDFITVKNVYKTLYENAPTSLFTFRNNSREIPLRNTGIDLTLPNANTEFRKKCFDYAGAQKWNSLPHDIRNALTLSHFKYLVKRFILSNNI